MNYPSEEFMEDVAMGMVSAGLPEAYHISEAIYDRDTEALAYHLKVAGTVHGTWYTGYRLVMLWDLYRHGGKNIMNFHKAMQGVNALRGITLSAVSSLVVFTGVHYGLKYWLGETDQSSVIHGYDVTREQRIQQYSGYQF